MRCGLEVDVLGENKSGKRACDGTRLEREVWATGYRFLVAKRACGLAPNSNAFHNTTRCVVAGHAGNPSMAGASAG